MQITLYTSWQRSKPAGTTARSKRAFEAGCVGWIVDNIADERPRCCGFENGEHGGCWQRGGELIG